MNKTHSFVKKLTALMLCLLMLLPVVSSGFAPLSALLDGVVLGADAEINSTLGTSTHKAVIAVPETIYMTPSTGASTTGQYYVNNTVTAGSYTVTPEVNAANTKGYVQFYIPGAKSFTIQVNTITSGIGDIVLAEAGATSGSYENTPFDANADGSFAYNSVGFYISGTGITAGNTALAEWVFTVTMNDGSVRKYYAYSTLYSPWYLPVGAAARAKSSQHSTYASSILWVSGVHGYSDGSRANSYYAKTSNFLPILGTIKTPGTDEGKGESPDSSWIQSGSNGLSPTISYQNKDGGNYHVYSNVISPTANLTVDTSRYNNFNQIPNFRIGFMVTDRDNSNNKEYLGQNGKNYYYVSEYSASVNINNNSYFNGTGGSSSQYTDYFNDKGTQISNWYSDSDPNHGIKVNQQQWDKAISGTANFRIKSAVKSGTGKTITTTAWNNNFVNISVTGANKADLRKAVLEGASLNANNYTAASWNAYLAELRSAAQKLGNPTATDTAITNLTTKRNALQTTVTFNANGGTLVGNATEAFTIGTATTATYTATTTATRTGYTFKGWSTDKNATTGATSLTLGFNQTVYAIWSANSYNVTFDNMFDFSKFTIRGNLTVNERTNTGFTVTSTAADGNTEFSDYIPVEAGKTYIFTADVEFEPAEGGYDMYVHTVNANKEGETTAVPDTTNGAHREGNVYISLTGQVTTGLKANKKPYIRFTAGDNTAFVRIRFDANAVGNVLTVNNIRVCEDNGVTVSPVNKVVTFDDPYGTLPTPTKTGYSFTGWVDANGNSVDAGTTVKTASNHALYSTWKINQYTITFKDTGDKTIDPITQNYGTEVKKPANPTKEGSVFVGWDKEIPDTMPAENLTITATWKTSDANYTVVHYQQKVDGTYEIFETEKTVYSFSETEIERDALLKEYKKEYTGFTFNEVTDKDGNPIDSSYALVKGDNKIELYYTRNQYTITFDTDGGTEIAAIEQYYDSAVTAPADPTKTGYKFAGWDVAVPEKMPAGDMTITAKWEIEQYTITFANTGDTKIDPITQDYNTAITAPANPTKEGYTFAGWDKQIPATMPAENITITAKWTVNQYTITFADTGDTVIAPITQDYGTTVTAPADPEKEGYTFTGWDVAVPEKMPAGDMTITAKWTINQYTITFANTGDTKIDPIKQDYGTAITAPADPTKEGYTFTGWDVAVPATMPAENITITAKWEINQYTITFANTGDSTIDPITQDYGTAITAPANPTKTGYKFAGWDVAVPEKMPAGDMTITAKWEIEQYTITFANTGDTKIDPIKQDYGTAITAPADPTKEGYTFTGWDVAVPATMPAENITITATWKINQYTISFDTDGGSAVEAITADYGTAISAPANPTKDGFDFVSWSPALPETMPAEDITLTAQWEPHKYTITFANTGETTIDPIKQDCGSEVTAPVDPEKTGYTFAGWYNGENEVTFPIGMPAYDMTLTAAWTINQYTITFKDYDDSVLETRKLDYGAIVAKPQKPEREGYTFKNWSPMLPNNMPAEDITVVAVWTPNTDTAYKVVHYLQDIGAETYTLVESDTQHLTGTTMKQVETKPNTYAGFKSPAAQTVTILPDGSATVEYYYTRNKYTVSFDANGGFFGDSDEKPLTLTSTFEFGEKLENLQIPTFAGYSFAGWTPELPETMPARNLAVMAVWTPNSDTPYTVYHYFQDTDCISYPDELMRTEIRTGETGATVEVETLDVEGFTAPAKRSIVIAADGSRTVRYYYTRNIYTVTFLDHNDNILEIQSVVYGLAATPPALEDRAPDAEGHYTFNGWSEDISCISGYATIKALYTAETHNPGADADCENSLTCTVCGYEIAPANGHSPIEHTPAVAPTCTTAGNTADSTCSVCGKELSKYSIVPALGHRVSPWYVDIPATETTTGVLKRICNGCDWFETHEIPVLSDTPVTSVDISTQGSQAYIGTSYQLKTNIKPADAGNKQVIWESSDPSVASVTADGYITSYKPGEVTFTVITLDGLKTDSITVNFFYSAEYYDLLVLDLFACNLTLDGKPLNATTGQVVRVKAGSTLAFTINPTTTAYLDQGGYIFTANGSNVAADANGVYYIYNVHENIEISALPAIGKPEFDDDQQYDTEEVPQKSIFAKILAFFERIMEWFRNLFK